MDYMDRKRASEGTRNNILESMIRLAEEKGTLDLSINELAEGCGFTPASLYAYFESKNDMIRSVRKEMERRFDTIINLPIPEKIPENMKIKMLTFYMFDFVDKNRWAVDYINPFSGHSSTERLLKRIISFLEIHKNERSDYGKDYRGYTFLAGVYFKVKYRMMRNESPTENDIEDISHFMAPHN